MISKYNANGAQDPGFQSIVQFQNWDSNKLADFMKIDSQNLPSDILEAERCFFGVGNRCVVLIYCT